MIKDSYMVYQREIEGMERLIKQLKIKQEILSDPYWEDELTPEDTPDFKSNAYVSKEVEIGVKIKDLERKLGETRKRIQFIYGDDG